VLTVQTRTVVAFVADHSVVIAAVNLIDHCLKLAVQTRSSIALASKHGSSLAGKQQFAISTACLLDVLRPNLRSPSLNRNMCMYAHSLLHSVLSFSSVPSVTMTDADSNLLICGVGR
jgi:hypothetical protein